MNNIFYVDHVHMIIFNKGMHYFILTPLIWSKIKVANYKKYLSTDLEFLVATRRTWLHLYTLKETPHQNSTLPIEN